MSRDLQLKVQLNPEEYIAFRAIADEQGQSQSGLARQLIKRAIREYAESDTAVRLAPTDDSVQE